jgi:flagellar biosynthesis GTPase FlhF
MLRQEMAALRKEFSLSRQMMPWQDGLRLSPAVAPLVQAMSDVGIPAGLRALMTDSIQQLDNVQDAWTVMEDLLTNAMARVTVQVPDSGVHALCGPSGSGKTSMVGRLAWAAAQAHGADRQVMISFADQRPGAWAQMQLLAAQSGVTCLRAADAEMLGTLLDDLGDKTVWIDTCGTDFTAQAELLKTHHPKILRHAVLPVDATVSSVQKILETPHAGWSTLMLSKVDEAAYPWALIKGLTEQSLAVSCMAGDSRIHQMPSAFDPVHLVKLALLPLQQQMPPLDLPHESLVSVMTKPELPPTLVAKPARRPRVATSAANKKMSTNDQNILTPTLMGIAAAPKPRRKPSAVSTSKAVHG